jgi:hypothetical protein
VSAISYHVSNAILRHPLRGFVERGIPGSADPLGVDTSSALATDFSTNSHCHPLVDGFPVLGLSFMLPVAKSLNSYRKSVYFGWTCWLNLCW